MYVRQVAGVFAALPAPDRSQAVLLADNYGEAGALDRYGSQYRPPPLYSGHNELYNFGPPPDSARVVVAVGLPLSALQDSFASCAGAATLDNGVGVDNEEQGRPIIVCRDPVRSWRVLWPGFQHYS